MNTESAVERKVMQPGLDPTPGVAVSHNTDILQYRIWYTLKKHFYNTFSGTRVHGLQDFGFQVSLYRVGGREEGDADRARSHARSCRVVR